MAAIAFWGSVIASVILYVNIVSTLKKVKNDENTGENTVIGCICIAFITISVLCLCIK